MSSLRFIFYLDIVIITLTAIFLAGGLFAAFYEIPFWHTLNVALAVVGSVPTFIVAARALLKLTITIDVFSSVALGAALYFSPDIRSAQYIILMLTFARLVDYFTQARAKRAIGALLDLKPKSARVQRGEAETHIPLEEVRVGDIVVVESGEKIPIDGVVEKGDGLVNESPLSGESHQIYKRFKDKVYASTINESGLLYVRTEKTGKDTTFAKIIELVESAQASKAPTQRIADTFAAWFLPATLLVVGSVWYFTGDITMSIALLLVICADEIAVATPIAIVAGIAQAARAGVIIKGGVHLENLSHITTIVLDKSGTLTYGKQDISFIRTFWGTTEDALFSFAATAEKHSEHPLARTLLAYARKRNIPYVTPDSFENVQGEGVKAGHKGKTIFVGNARFIADNNIHIQDVVQKHIAEESALGATPVIVGYDSKVIGVISITDALRVSAKDAIRKLHGLGIKKIIMMTGDNKEVAKQVADFLGIDEWHAEMLPEDKYKRVKALADAGEKVLMVGDGVNDAPALSAAHVGVAMGAIGADAAIEAADIALMNDNIERLPELIGLSRRVMGAIHGNIGLWIGSNTIGMALVFMGMVGPVGAALFNFLTDFIPLGNSLRLFKKVT